MKITMISMGTTGDVRPIVLLGKELASRGHEITIAAFSHFREMVESSGLHFFQLSGDAEKFIANVMKPGTSALTFLPQVQKTMKDVAPQLIQDLSDSCDGMDAIVCSFFGSVFYSIAEQHHIPCVQVHYYPMDPNGNVPISPVKAQGMGKAVNELTYRLGYLLIGAVEHHFLSEWRVENGLRDRKPKTMPDYRIGDKEVPVVYAISPNVLPRPAQWGESIHMSGFWFDETPCTWEPPEDLRRFMEEGEPPVYIGFGSMNSGDMNKTMTKVLRAVRASGVRAVINLGWSGQKLHSGSKVYFGEYIPHDWLFPRVRAVVHHGGAGTTAAGLRYGKPTLVIPFGGDQPFWGQRVYELGCGPKPISRQSLTVQKLTKALLDLSATPRYRVAAEEMSERLSMEKGTVKAADIIEKEIANW